MPLRFRQIVRHIDPSKWNHPRQGCVVVDEQVLQRTANVQRQAHAKQYGREVMQRAEHRGQLLAFGNQRQVLRQRPPYGRKSVQRRMVQPATQRHHDNRTVKRPMHSLGRQVFQPSFGMQWHWLRLNENPGDSNNRKQQNRDTQCLVQ